MPNQSGSSNRRKIRRTVTYYTASRKPRPAVITGLASNGGVVLRIGRHDTSASAGVQLETLGNSTTGILKRTSRTQTNVWDVS